MVGGMYLKVSPAGLACGPITSGGRIYTLTHTAGHRAPLPVLSFPFPPSPVSCRDDLNFTSFACLPCQFPGMSLHFRPLHCRFSSLSYSHSFPFSFPLSGSSRSARAFSCISVSLQCPLEPAIPLTFISFTSSHSCFLAFHHPGNAGGVVQY